MKIFHHGVGKLGATALRIEILVPKNKNPITFESAPGRREERSGVAEMQIACGRWSKPATI